MSLKMSFNKPKRNIRRRNFDEEEENENKSTSQVEEQSSHLKKDKKEKKREKPKQTLLSFGEELEEADDGEVFKVKKSSRSRRLMKQLDLERKKKKGEDKMKMDSDSSNMSNNQEKDLEIKTDDLVVKVKNSGPLILNGREALTAGKNDYSDEDEVPERSHRFQSKTDRADNMKFFLQSGCIPDAAMIHAARKKRQKARELGQDFIPVEEQSEETTGKGSRLIREEDNDRSDDEEERINMTVNTDELHKKMRRQAILDSQASPEKLSDQESAPEEDEWEKQQIRKGVTSSMMSAVQESVAMQYNSSVGYSHGLETGMKMMGNIPAAPPPPIIQAPDPSQTVPVSAEDVLKKMRERIEHLKEEHRRHEINCEEVEQEQILCKKELIDAETQGPEWEARYKFYQELRGYVTDLVECLNEKLPIISALESRWLDLYAERSNLLIERRRQDTRDQAEEITNAARGFTGRRGLEDDARMRRATEREGRRARRRRARELQSLPQRHVDGMSSDDEVTEQQNLSFRQTKEKIEEEIHEVFIDAEDDFCTVKGILAKLENWKEKYIDSYKEAYVSLCIPKMVSPIIRLSLITWNPLIESTDFEKTKWYSSLLFYTMKSNVSEEALQADPDIRLVPSTIEKIVIPKLTTIVQKIWDPLSTTQTLRLIGLINRFMKDYPTLNKSSKQLTALFAIVMEKMEDAIDNDVFIPIFPKQTLEPKHPYFQRQFHMAMKLLRNFLSWQGLIEDDLLKNIALTCLLNRYLLAGLRINTSVDAMNKAYMIMMMLPRAWLQGKSMDSLKMFASVVKQISEDLDQANPAHNEAWEYSKAILKVIKV
ncbi:hypothetical protein TKK_0015251 [Trichogramma kaykai]